MGHLSSDHHCSRDNLSALVQFDSLKKDVLVARLANSNVLPSCDLTVVEGDGVQTGEQLSLVLVDSLHLDVEHGVWVDDQVVVLIQVCRELYFVLLRDRQRRSERGLKTNPDGRMGTFLIRATSRMNTSLSVYLRMFFS